MAAGQKHLLCYKKGTNFLKDALSIILIIGLLVKVQFKEGLGPYLNPFKPVISRPVIKR